MKSLIRGIRLIFLIWVGLVVIAIALGFVHQARKSHLRPTQVNVGEER